MKLIPTEKSLTFAIKAEDTQEYFTASDIAILELDKESLWVILEVQKQILKFQEQGIPVTSMELNHARATFLNSAYVLQSHIQGEVSKDDLYHKIVCFEPTDLSLILPDNLVADVQTVYLTVTETSCHFTGYVKHLDAEVWTDPIPITFIKELYERL